MGTLSRQQVHNLVADGHLIVIYNHFALQLDSWLNRHPGGDKAILHMVGRDATDEINGKETLQKALSFRIGKVELPWENMLPPIQGGRYHKMDSERMDTVAAPQSTIDVERVVKTLQDSRTAQLSEAEISEIRQDLSRYPSLDAETQGNIVREYRKLEARLADAGLYQCNYWSYGAEMGRYLILAVCFVVLLRNSYVLCSAFFLGLFWHQVTFVAHDAGHLELTHDYFKDTLVGTLVASGLGGLSLSWWKRNHNVHHIVTNQPEHDPDIQHMPLFAVSTRLLESVRSTYYDRVLSYDAVAKFMLKIQSMTYYPILCFGRFNLYRLSYEHLLLKKGPQYGQAKKFQYLEVVLICLFWYWYGYLTVYKSIASPWRRFLFVLISNVTTMPLHVQITLSHFAMSTADLGPCESFPQRQLRTTMDVDCPAWLDFIHGGLQFQAIHHLFPRMPRHRLRECQPYVRDFSKRVGIEYKTYGFVDGNQVVISKLAEISKQASMMNDCLKSMLVDHKKPIT